MENEEELFDLEEMLINFSKDIEPKLPVPFEFRLYYREDGSIITYSCEELEGNYVVIDAETFAIGRQDIKVIDGKIEAIIPTFIINKLVEAEDGISCAAEDINIPVSNDHEGESTKWTMKHDEFKFN
jgi:hypothetical protein